MISGLVNSEGLTWEECSASYVGVGSLIDKMWVDDSKYWKGTFGKTNNDIFFSFYTKPAQA